VGEGGVGVGLSGGGGGCVRLSKGTVFEITCMSGMRCRTW